MEVIYSGLHRTVDQIVRSAIQEDVDVISLSIMSEAHLPITEKLLQRVREKGIEDKMVVVGGVIPTKDIQNLKGMGAKGVFPGGVPFKEMVAFLKENVMKIETEGTEIGGENGEYEKRA